MTWLYGPLQPGSSSSLTAKTDTVVKDLSKRSPPVWFKKKLIVMTRNIWKIMLQWLKSNIFLAKQDIAAIQTRKGRSTTQLFTRRSHSGSTPLYAKTWNGGKKNQVHFDELVEQRIALLVKEDDEDEVSKAEPAGVMMKWMRIRKKSRFEPGRPTQSCQPERKTMRMLPWTTLKPPGDAIKPIEVALKHSSGVAHDLSPFSSACLYYNDKPENGLSDNISFQRD